MRRVLAIMLLSLAACAAGLARTMSGPSGPQAWQLPTGKPPSQVEYAALLAACQDRVHSTSDTNRIDACLSGNYDMRRAP
jgi:hypothetical protein